MDRTLAHSLFAARANCVMDARATTGQHIGDGLPEALEINGQGVATLGHAEQRAEPA